MAIFAGAAAGSSAAAGTTAAASTAATTTTAATVASYAATALLVASSIRAGQASKVGLQVQAEKARDDAQKREVNRRRKLVQSLASQNATRAASGIAYLEGSSRDMALEDIRTGQGSIDADVAGSDYYASQLEAQGGYAQNTGYIAAGASLLDQVDRTMQRG